MTKTKTLFFLDSMDSVAPFFAFKGAQYISGDIAFVNIRSYADPQTGKIVSSQVAYDR